MVRGMTKLDIAIEQIRLLPLPEQDKVADAIIAMSTSASAEEFVFSSEELAELERRMANPGKLYSLDEVFG
jgi:hypothetical protein